jgi:hypothetical protein
VGSTQSKLSKSLWDEMNLFAQSRDAHLQVKHPRQEKSHTGQWDVIKPGFDSNYEYRNKIWLNSINFLK